jgi:branched-chain amino acid transport system permease protein
VTAFYSSHLVLIQQTLINLLIVLSIQIPLRFGVFSLAGSGSYAFGAYTAAILNHRYGLGAFSAIAVAVVLSALLGLILAALLQRLDGLYLGMATIAVDLIISVIANNGGSFTGGPTGLYGIVATPNISTGTVASVAMCAVILAAASERGRLGRRVVAVRRDRQLAASLGVNVGRYRTAAFVISGAVGGCAGALDVFLLTTIAPSDISFSTVTIALTMIIVGGSASWLGALIGAIIFTWLPDLLTIVTEWEALIYGAIVTLAAVWAPDGILGIARSVFHNWQVRRAGTVVGAAEDSGHGGSAVPSASDVRTP